jgi:uncharacterized membrane protein
MSTDTKRRISTTALGVIFLAVAVLHARKREYFASLVPDPLKEHEAKVDVLTEVLMATSGVCFLVPRFNPVARWLSTTFLVPSFLPALDQVRDPERRHDSPVPAVVTVARIPAHAGMLAWIRWATAR